MSSAFLPKHFLNQLLERTSLVTLIGAHTRLEKKGQSFLGLCPFHSEKTPSFSVDDEKGLYHCFGCGESGNAISFLKNHQRLSFMESVEFLADSCGMTVPRPSIENSKEREKEEKEQQQRDNLYRIMELSSLWFEESLYSGNASAKRALNYLYDQRQLSDKTIKTFRLGWAPSDPKQMINALIDKGCSLDDMITLGLANDNKSSPTSFFRSRLIIPITDYKNRVCAFGGRIFEQNSSIVGKYINSKNNPIFNKSKLVFNLYKAKKYKSKDSHLVLVEGYMDVITLHQNGFKSAVATLGTSANENHLKTLWRISPEPIVCFDSDEGGYNATNRLVKIAMPLISPDKTLKFAQMPKGEDPDSLLSAGSNRQKFNNILETSQPLSSWLWQYLRQKYPRYLPEDFGQIKREGKILAESIKDSDTKEDFKKHFRNMIDSLWNLRKFSSSQATRSKTITQTKISGPSPQNRPLVVLMALVRHPYLLSEFSSLLSGFPPDRPTLKQLTHCLLDSIWLPDLDSYETINQCIEEQNLLNVLQILDAIIIEYLYPQIFKDDREPVRKLLTSIEKDLHKSLIRQELKEKVREDMDKPLDPQTKAHIDKIKDEMKNQAPKITNNS